MMHVYDGEGRPGWRLKLSVRHFGSENYGPQRIQNRSATLVLSSGTGGESVMWRRFTMSVVAKAIFGPT